jgi:hypothetical protein
METTYEYCANCATVLFADTAFDNDSALGEKFDEENGYRFLCGKCYEKLYPNEKNPEFNERPCI